jgi:hypothetical protein
MPQSTLPLPEWFYERVPTMEGRMGRSIKFASYLSVFLVAAACGREGGRPARTPTPRPTTAGQALQVLQVPSATPSSDWVTYADKYVNDERIALRRPPAWKPYVFRSSYHYSYPIVYLSTAELHDPCVKTAAAVNCGLTIRRLPPSGVWVHIAKNWFPRTGDPMQQWRGRLLDLNGHRAKLTGDTAMCDRMAGDSADGFSLGIEWDKSNYFSVDVCLRGPERNALERDVWAMLNSLKFTGLTKS